MRKMEQRIQMEMDNWVEILNGCDSEEACEKFIEEHATDIHRTYEMYGSMVNALIFVHEGSYTIHLDCRDGRLIAEANGMTTKYEVPKTSVLNYMWEAAVQFV